MLEIVGGVDREQLGVAVRHEAVAEALHLATHDPVIGDLPVMDDGDVVIGIGPIGMRRADIDVGLGRHAGMADAVRALEGAEPVLLGDLGRVAEILDQLKRAAERQHLGAVDLLDLGGKAPRVAGIA